MTDYTPTEAEVRAAFSLAFVYAPDTDAMHDRFLASVKATALREAAEEVANDGEMVPRSGVRAYLVERAAAIEKGAGDE